MTSRCPSPSVNADRDPCASSSFEPPRGGSWTYDVAVPAVLILDLAALCGGIATIVVSIMLLAVSVSSVARPRRLIATGEAFLVPARKRVRLLQVAQPSAFVVPLIAGTVNGLRQTGNPAQSPIAVATAWTSGTALVVVLVVLAISAFRWNSPPLTITSVGVRGVGRARSWDQLAVPGRYRWLPAADRQPAGFTFVDWDADPRYVGWLIAYYQAHPERRSVIGEAAELDRLGQLAATGASPIAAG